MFALARLAGPESASRVFSLWFCGVCIMYPYAPLVPDLCPGCA